MLYIDPNVSIYKNPTRLLDHGFSESGICMQLRWVLPAQGLPRSCNRVSAEAAESCFQHHWHGCWTEGLKFLLAVGWKNQFFVMWTSLWGSSQHGSWLLQEREREREREKEPRTEASVFVTWPWKWHLIASAIFCSWIINNPNPGLSWRANAGTAGLILGRGAKIPHASWPENRNIKQKQYCHKFNKDFFFFFLKFIIIIILLYNIVLVLPYINMHLPRVYTCSPSWTPLPPPSPYHPSGSSLCTSPKLPVSCIKSGLAIRFLYDIIHVLMPFSQIIPPSLSQSPKDCSRHLCLFCCLAYRVVVTIFLHSIYMH